MSYTFSAPALPRTSVQSHATYTTYGKRWLDILFSIGLFVVLAPILLVVAVVSAIDTKGCPLFFQWRGGVDGKPFRIIKFRTMSTCAPADVATCKLKNPDQYISRVGKFLRKTSLDELPQLWNIFVGDMSFIGPRPVVLTEKRLLNMRLRNGASSVRPGMTGLAQVSGRDELPIEKKARLDAFYAHNMSMMGDLAILSRTVTCVLRAEGVHDGPRSQEVEAESAQPAVCCKRRSA